MFTANIEVHHVHHLCSRIPYYRWRDQPQIDQESLLEFDDQVVPPGETGTLTIVEAHPYEQYFSEMH